MALPFEDVSFAHAPKSETLALIQRIENGEETLYRFNSVDELLTDLNSEDGDD